MAERPHNFNAGPSILPLEVMEEVRDQLLDTAGSGLSVIEWSHRSPDYAKVHAEAEERLRRLLALPADGEHEILFLQGGASLQFAAVAMNLAQEAGGDYVLTGSWSKKALAEAERVGPAHCLWSGEDENFSRLPEAGAIRPRPEADYLHLTSNNTIFGTQWSTLPEGGDVPVVVDMSSDILSRDVAMGSLGLVYAGAQKNLGPAGLAVVIVRRDLLERVGQDVPKILTYAAHVKADGLYHTPPTFAVWLMTRVLDWIERQGGAAGIGARNAEKSALLYRRIDASDFYRGTAAEASRSTMNVTWRLPDEAKEAAFLEQAKAAGFVGLKGHRSVGGIRASLYNAMPRESVEALVAFMDEFERTQG